jgi:uncharacterized protein YjiS (DUF1127 family)
LNRFNLLGAIVGELKMATIEMFQTFRDEAPADSAGSGFLPRLRQAFRTMGRRIEERRTIARLSRLSPHLIEDMGLEPAAIYGALRGTWDEVNEDRFPRV